ncbi:MAG: glycosyl hydrolase 108 family protein [Pseudohongiella sp.]|nr:glycosyl hydrolase 108 family protein [Pseudohongiella sp.]
MSNIFFRALQETLLKEGKLSTNSADRGGITNYGISIRFLKLLPLVDADVNGDGHVTEADIRALTGNASHVAHLYKKYFWDHYRLDECQHPRIAIKLFDMLVNMRSVMAVKCLQRALRACNTPVLEDGVLGSKTFAAIANIQDERNLLAPIRSEAFGTYQLIVAADASQAQFLPGWKNRAYS